MASNSTTQTVITIDGIDTPITFTDLNLDERVLDTNSFSFAWTPSGNDGSLSSIVKFKDDNLSKGVTVKFNDVNGNENHVFKGIITQIESAPNSDLYVSFQISGNGMFCRIHSKVECNSFYKQTLMDIISHAGSVNGATLLMNAAKQSDPIQYTVQYNQTSFDFIKMLAIRYGEWMYYNGDTLIFGGSPNSDPVMLRSGQDITNIKIHAHAAKANENAFGFDVFKGEIINGKTEAAAPAGSPLLAVGGKAGGNIYTNNGTGTYFPGAATQQMLDGHNKIQQQAAIAGCVFISASSRISKITVGSVINITDQKDKSGKKFIVTEINHSADNNHAYINHFKAVPLEVEAPPYTDPWVCPRATTQPAIVVENEDADGHDRIKVRFPWMKKSETTPWIQVITPHAGKNKGFRWIPEKDEEVMIDFIDNNAERPVMVGAMYTSQNKSGSKYASNNIKGITTKSGHTVQIDDAAGITIKDKAGNMVHVDGAGTIEILSSIKIRCKSNDIEFECKNFKVTAETSIGLGSKGTYTASASGMAKMESTAAGASITAAQLALVHGDTQSQVTSPSVHIEGSGGTIIKGGTVEINC